MLSDGAVKNTLDSWGARGCAPREVHEAIDAGMSPKSKAVSDEASRWPSDAVCFVMTHHLSNHARSVTIITFETSGIQGGLSALHSKHRCF